MDADSIFYATNKHSPVTGELPRIDANTPNRYHSYFENAYGEQLIFVFDFETEKGTLYHGDVGWGNQQPVHEGTAPQLVLDDAEMLWLRACWMAVTEQQAARLP